MVAGWTGGKESDRAGAGGVGTAARPGLLVRVADLDGQREGGQMLLAGHGRPARREQDFAEAVQGLRLAGATSAVGGSTLIEHWNGTRWSVVPSPTPGGDPSLTGVAARGPAAPSVAVCCRSPTHPDSGSNGSTPSLPRGRDTELMVDDNARDRAIYHALKAADEVAAALQAHLIEEHGADPDRAAAQNSFTNSFKLLRQARERLGEGLRAVGAGDIAGSDGISLRNS